ncbi:thiamine pyrophosphate-binding protein [Limnoraphis robusta Tam1]|uniref:alpha-keto acid decarboxylase family protein n=1 Tax=Limnoraphis robusta TaxID=1118279 RepID=UPI002B211658|nr:thiamine pyrophosphate-binding protein [Limnoraphis robusta]MEA5537863.1 thiamine pyrophosphate-binding protein [Limnoraphis robusta Tam1]
MRVPLIEKPVVGSVTTTVGEYLVSQLEAVGVRHVFGVPGDYVLDLMDIMVESSMQLVGTCNELNAGYAADAYARLNGVGALCVTYGVGGLSVVNALAGAYAEEVPVIVISGAPRTSAKGKHLLMHHTTGDYNLQLSILEKVTIAAVTLTNAEQAPAQIDRTIAACLRYKRPVYIEIPVDMVAQPCVTPLSFERPNPLVSDVQALNEAINEAVEWLENSEHPVILAGVELHRYGIQKKLHQLVETTGYPIASTLLGKSSISELHPQFIGNYAGALSRDYVRNRVESADCILCLGAIMSDMNLGGYTAKLKESQLINANSEKVKIKHHYYYPIDLGDFIDGLIAKLSRKSYDSLDIQPASQLLSKSFQVQPEHKITNARFYERMNHFVGDNSTVIAETGDAIIATIDLLIHADTRFIGQAFYMSIGYTLPACLGAALARPQNRVILFIGDGSFQMTCQELSTMIRLGLNPIIFLINNDGYTIERMIHDGSYNDIQPWKYHQLPQVFGESINCEVRTEGELEDALKKASDHRDRLCFIEVHLDRFDCCQTLARLTQAVRQN